MTKISLPLLAAAVSISTAITVSLVVKRYLWWIDRPNRLKRIEASKSLVGPNVEMVEINNNNIVGDEDDKKDNGKKDDKTRMLTSVHYGTKTSVTVVLIHGFGCTSMDWHYVTRALMKAGDFTVFNYDRVLFLENRTNLPSSRDSSVLVQELHHLLVQRRGIEPPYLLVGHSYGGFIAKHYAMTHPHDVAGLVLVDPAHEDQYELFPPDFVLGFKVIIPMVLTLYRYVAWTGILRVMDRLSLFNFPPIHFLPKNSTVRTALATYLYADGHVWKTVVQELEGCSKSFQQMKATKKKKNTLQRIPETIPLAFVIANHRRYSPSLFPKAITQAFLQMHNQDDFPGSMLFLAHQSDHWIQLEQPDIVLEAIYRLLDDVTATTTFPK